MFLEIVLTDPDVIHSISSKPAGNERQLFIQNALRLGTLAMESATSEVDAQHVRSEVSRMLSQLQTGLEKHTEHLEEKMNHSLAGFFDPNKGVLTARLTQLLKDGGDLEQLMRKLVVDENSELSKTLSSHVGTNSPLFKILDPDQSKGLLASLQSTVDAALTSQSEAVLSEFSLDNDGGALKRLVDQISQSQGKLSKGIGQQVETLVEEFSLDKEDSALSRLMNSVHGAQQSITGEFSLDRKESALSKLREELTSLFKQQNEASRAFREEVTHTLSQLNERRAERQRGTQHGNDFEADVVAQIAYAETGSETAVQATGSKVGRIKSCRVGDAVLIMGPEHVAAGAKIVVEAKQKKGYGMVAARKEIERARQNRDAIAGLFVFSKKSAPEELPSFSRFGNDIFVVWDAEDANTDVVLSAGLSVAKAVCVSKQRNPDSLDVDFKAMETALLGIEGQVNALSDVERWTTTISNNAEKILNNIKRVRKGLTVHIETLDAQLDSIKNISE